MTPADRAAATRPGDCLAVRHFRRAYGTLGGNVVCTKPDGHTDAHEGIKGRTAYCWTNARTGITDPQKENTDA